MHVLLRKIAPSNYSLRHRTGRAAISATAICVCIHFGIPYETIRVFRRSSIRSHQNKIRSAETQVVSKFAKNGEHQTPGESRNRNIPRLSGKAELAETTWRPQPVV